MNQLLTLVKNDLRTSFNINSLSKSPKKKNKNSKNGNLVTLLIIGLFLVISFSYSFSIATMSSIAQMKYTTLYFGMGVGTIVCLFMTLAKSYSTLFKSKDFELLMSMPIPPKTILTAKFISLSTVGFACFSLFYIPAVICNQIVFGIDKNILLYSLLVIFLAPMLVITICGIGAYIINRALAKFKFKNALKIGFALLFIVLYLVAVFSFTMDPGNLEGEDIEVYINLCQSVENIFSKIYYPSNWIIKALESEVIYLVPFIAISIIPFIGFIYFVSKNFLSANTIQTSYKNEKFKLVEQKSNSISKALIKKEIKTFFSSTTYVMNCLMGPIISIILTVMFCIMAKDPEAYEMTEFIDFLPLVLMVMTSFMIGMVPTTACSINFEGNKFWILKSSPITSKQILNAKLYLYILICIPACLINGIISNILVEMNILSRILIFIIPLIISSIYGLEGLLINTKIYKLNWISEAEAIKQATSTLWSMLLGLAIMIVILIPSIIITFIINLNVGLITLLLISSFTCYIMYIITMKHGVKSLNKILC